MSVSSGGLAIGAAAGEADIRAVYGGATGWLHVKLQPRTFAVSGVILDSDSGRSIDAEVEIVDGANAGKVTRLIAALRVLCVLCAESNPRRSYTPLKTAIG